MRWKNEKVKLVGHMIRHNMFLKNIIKGKIMGSKAGRRTCRTWWDLETEEMKRVVCYRDWKVLCR